MQRPELVTTLTEQSDLSVDDKQIKVSPRWSGRSSQSSRWRCNILKIRFGKSTLRRVTAQFSNFKRLISQFKKKTISFIQDWPNFKGLLIEMEYECKSFLQNLLYLLYIRISGAQIVDGGTRMSFTFSYSDSFHLRLSSVHS